MLLPRLEMSALILAVAPPPTVTMMITAATPITIPSTVRKERSALRRISRRARSSTSCHIAGPRGARFVGRHDAVHETHGAARTCRHLGLVGDHHDGDAL